MHIHIHLMQKKLRNLGYKWDYDDTKTDFKVIHVLGNTEFTLVFMDAGVRVVSESAKVNSLVNYSDSTETEVMHILQGE